MKITIDTYSGFCFGVVYAIEMAESILRDEGSLYCLGDIVHNNKEVERLNALGLKIIDYNSEYKATEYYENFVTHSEFRPYVTQVGLYDEQNRLLAHAKLGKPIKLDDQYDTSFVVRFDV